MDFELIAVTLVIVVFTALLYYYLLRQKKRILEDAKMYRMMKRSLNMAEIIQRLDMTDERIIDLKNRIETLSDRIDELEARKKK